MKVAIVHEWLDTYAGSERVLEQMLALWPEADLYALCDFLPASERGFLGGRTPRTSFLQRLPFARRRFRSYLGLMPLAVEGFDLSGYDLVLSSSHAVAKGAITGPGTLHLAYVHSPMRYAWDLQAQYLRESGLDRGLKGAYARWLLHRLRLWDQASAARPDAILANSRYIAERIRKAWRREAEVLHPPVDTEAFTPRMDKEPFYLVASRLAPYKRVDLVAAAFRRMPRRQLVIVGDGPQRAAVRQAAGDAANIVLRGHVPRDELIRLMRSASACLHAAEEDFGIALVEAQACGTPMIAFGRGGARDIVRTPEESDAPTGLLFDEQSAEAIVSAVERFESDRAAFTPRACRANAERFSIGAFRAGLGAAVARHLGRG
ncbi:MAG: glycosyltransferase [Acetobacteraceae bacterium]